MISMAFFNIDPSIKRYPPEKVSFRSLDCTLLEDGKKVHIKLELTPFQESPYIEISIYDAEENEVSSATIVEPVFWKQELTMHIRGNLPAGSQLRMIAKVYYPEKDYSSRKTKKLTIPIPSAGEIDEEK